MKDVEPLQHLDEFKCLFFSFPFSSARDTLAYLFHQVAPPLKRTSALTEKSGNFQ